ncbi:hypothetical protein [Sedimentitalea arenosa]|uniref:Uncharacterized protein n=1 Tax=Sedimentitalea arenosa TaxID=2798803 RepID=A0A8J7J0W9_9RHOB|nr:hypothetical protein [Arenibacterium arenosum]MBJ6370370.1 hypothetical protein [Arenibacterium arenosum]
MEERGWLHRALHKLKRQIQWGLAWTNKNVPKSLRLLLGILLIAGGVFGFLPVLGFWMLPLGVVIIWEDLKDFWSRLTGNGSSEG